MGAGARAGVSVRPQTSRRSAESVPGVARRRRGRVRKDDAPRRRRSWRRRATSATTMATIRWQMMRAVRWQVIAVTADSVAMASEACSTPKPVCQHPSRPLLCACFAAVSALAASVSVSDGACLSGSRRMLCRGVARGVDIRDRGCCDDRGELVARC
eukprot:642661-Rhodomonas_salina.2